MKNRSNSNRIIKYWCDHCFKKTIGKDDIICYESRCWTDLRDYRNHIGTKLHKKNIENTEKNHHCTHCNKYFDDIGWKLHTNRNSEMWQKYALINKPIVCNQFVSNGKNYSSFDAMRYDTEDTVLLRKYKKEAEDFAMETESSVDTSDEELFIDELNKDYETLEDPTPSGDICEVCNRHEYYSYTNHSTILTETEKDYIRYNLNITNYCDCIDEDYEPKVIDLLSSDSD